MTSIWRIPPERKNGHPAPFPLMLPLRVIYSILDEKFGIVIDPYVGSGTTAVAAKLLGANFIGIDVSAEYIKKAKERLLLAESEKYILDNELSKHIVEKTFADRKMNLEFTGKYHNLKISENTLL